MIRRMSTQRSLVIKKMSTKRSLVMMTRMGKKMNVLRCRLQTANVGRDTFKGGGGYS